MRTSRVFGGILVGLVLGACSTPSTFSKEGVSFQHPQEWNLGDVGAPSANSKCGQGSWEVPLTTADGVSVQVQRCVPTGLGRRGVEQATDDVSLADNDSPIQTTRDANVTMLRAEGELSEPTAKLLDREPRDRYLVASIVPPAEDVTYRIACFLPSTQDSLAPCNELLDSFQIPERNDAVPEYVANDLIRYRFDVTARGNDGKPVSVLLAYTQADGTFTAETVTVPWESDVLAAPRGLIVQMTAQLEDGPATTKLQCGMLSDSGPTKGLTGVSTGLPTCAITGQPVEETTDALTGEVPGSESPSDEVASPPPGPRREGFIGRGILVFSGDREARVRLDIAESIPGFENFLDQDSVDLTWRGGGHSVWIEIDPAAVGTIPTSDITLTPPMANINFSAPARLQVENPWREGECTITLITLTDTTVQGRFVCPRQELANAKGKYVRVEASFFAQQS